MKITIMKAEIETTRHIGNGIIAENYTELAQISKELKSDENKLFIPEPNYKKFVEKSFKGILITEDANSISIEIKTNFIIDVFNAYKGIASKAINIGVKFVNIIIGFVKFFELEVDKAEESLAHWFEDDEEETEEED